MTVRLVAKDKDRRGDTFERKTFSVSRLAEFASISELIKQTGQPVENWVLAVTKELVDNGIDEAEEAGVPPVIEIAVEASSITVADRGRGIKPAVVKALIDYSTKTSSRAAIVSPSRGQQGNALQSIIPMGCALAREYGWNASDAVVIIESQGVAHSIRFAVDPVRQTPVVSRDVTPSAVKIGTRVTVRWPEQARSLVTAVDDDFFSLVEAYTWTNPHLTLDVEDRWDWQATIRDWTKWRPSMPSSAHWYDAERLSRHMAAEIAFAEDHGKTCPTVRDFIAEFRGLSGTAKQNAICTEIGVAGRETLAEFYRGPDAAAQLLLAMQARSNPVKPRDLGVIGKAHLLDRFVEDGCNPDSFGYRKAEIVHDGLPYVIEVAFGFRSEKETDYGRWVVEGFNFAPAIGDSPFQLEQRLENLDVEADDPVTVFAHVACPRLSFLDKGKAKLDLPGPLKARLSEMIIAVTKAWTKQKRAEMRHADARLRRLDEMVRRARPVSLKEAAYAVMPQAYLIASTRADGGRRLPVKPRQIMYKARPSILTATGKTKFDDGSFTQELLIGFMRDHPRETAEWDIIWDDRGHISEPHTNRLIGLGTLAVRNYIARFQKPAVKLASVAAAYIETFGPDGRFGGVLFNEKEGFEPIFEAADLYARYDLAPMSTKGMSTTAGRALVEELCGRRGLPLFVLHDFDKSGFSIHETLINNTERYEFEHPLMNVIEIGLRLPTVTSLGLQSEAFAFGKKEDLEKTAERLRINGATEDEIAFMLSPAPGHTTGGQRVELNSMSSAQLIALVEDSLIAHGVAKVIPGPETLAETYAAFKRGTMAQATLEAELARLNAAPVDVPADLDERVRAYLIEHPNATWDAAVKAVMARER